jgi:hypothetical protein
MTALQAKIAVATTQTVEVKLKPSLKRKLLNELQAYAALHTQLKAIEAQMAVHKVTLEECVIESGEQSLDFGDMGKTTMVFPNRTKFDHKLFVQQGGTLKQIENATVPVTTRPYLKVTLPGQKERVYDE